MRETPVTAARLEMRWRTRPCQHACGSGTGLPRGLVVGGVVLDGVVVGGVVLGAMGCNLGGICRVLKP